MQLLKNNVASTLGASLTNVATSLTLATGEGALFDSPTGGDFFLATLFQRSGIQEINHEIIKVTARAGDVLTIVRAQEGTTGLAFNVSDPIELRVTDGTLTDLNNNSVTTAGLTVNGNAFVPAGALSTSGAYALVMTLTGATNVTFPVTGTLATLAGSESLSNKTLVAPIITGSATAAALVASGQVSLGGTAGAESLRAVPVGSAVNRWNFGGAATGNPPYLEAEGSNTNIGLLYYTKGTGAHEFYSASSVRQFRVAHTATAVNYLEVTGAATGGSVGVSAQGSDTNIGMTYSSKGTGSQDFYTGVYRQMIVGYMANAVNYLKVTGAATGSGVTLTAQGSDTDIGLNYNAKGAGTHYFKSANGGAISFAMSPSGGTDVNYLQSVSSITGNAVLLNAAGTDSNVGITVTPKGTGTITAVGTLAVTGPLNEAKGADIASASTVNLTTATGNLVHITGTTGITAMTLGSGMERNLVFDGALTITHHATTMILPGGASITTAAGDRATVVGDGSGNTRMLHFTRAGIVTPASGTLAILGANTFTGTQALGNNNLTGIKTAVFNGEINNATTTGAVTIDWPAGAMQKQAEPTGSITYTFTAPSGPCHLQLRILSDGTSSAQTFTWPATVKWIGATWAAAANKNAVINFFYDGTDYWAAGSNGV